MWPLRTIGYFVLFWVGCAMALVNPIYGVITYMMVYQANPTVAWWGLPLANIGMRFSLFAASATMLGLVFGRRRVPDVHPALALWEVLLIALVMVAGFNMIIGIGIYSSTTYTFDKFWKVALFVLILTRLASTRQNLHLVLWALVAGCCYIGYDAYTAPVTAFVKGRLDRIGGPDFSTTSGAAAHMVAMLPLIGAAFLTTKSWSHRVFALVTGALTVNAVILCRTRSAFLGLLAGLVAALFLVPKVRRYRICFLFVVAIIGAYSLTDQHFWNRMSTLSDKQALEQDMAAVSRKEIWEAAKEMFTDYPLGVGPGNFTRKVGDYNPKHRWRATHNSVVACFTELGIQGGVIFLLLLIGSIRLLQRAKRMAHLTADPTDTLILSYTFFISFVTYIVTALGTQRLYCESFWWVAALPLCLYRAAEREARQSNEVPLLATVNNRDLNQVFWRRHDHVW